MTATESGPEKEGTGCMRKKKRDGTSLTGKRKGGARRQAGGNYRYDDRLPLSSERRREKPTGEKEKSSILSSFRGALCTTREGDRRWHQLALAEKPLSRRAGKS